MDVWGIDRYEKEFDSVQDAFELQVRPGSFSLGCRRRRRVPVRRGCADGRIEIDMEADD